ncbi:cytochrome P450 4d2-like [Anticarsia gemmatalis]|uniref:cytochrome P450 4d2-like n=1 Tax=Anticarsia gemmatalis TaxID=129554 RepID=UPI003F7648F9
MVSLYRKIGTDSLQIPFFGHGYKYAGDDETTMKNFEEQGLEANRKGGIVGIWLINTLYVMITDAADAEFVLKQCLEKDEMMKVTHVVIGNGSVFAPVPIWRPRRKALAPSFNPKNLNTFVQTFAQQSQIMADNMKAVVGGPTSLWTFVNTYSLDSICETTMGVKVGSQQNPELQFLKSLAKLFNAAIARMTRPWLQYDPVYRLLPHYKHLMKNKGIVCDFVDKIIIEKRKASEDEIANQKEVKSKSLKSFIDILLEANDENQSVYSNVELGEEALVLLVAGTDTSSVGIAFTLLLLARYPDVQEKVYQEIQEVFGDSDRPLVVEDLPHLKYLELVIKESLRLYPPVPIISRKVETEVTLPSGLTLTRDCGIFVNIWALHRNQKYWGEDAHEFKPERFINTALTHPAAYMAFSYGPRGCIGKYFLWISHD